MIFCYTFDLVFFPSLPWDTNMGYKYTPTDTAPALPSSSIWSAGLLLALSEDSKIQKMEGHNGREPVGFSRSCTGL